MFPYIRKANSGENCVLFRPYHSVWTKFLEQTWKSFLKVSYSVLKSFMLPEIVAIRQ